MWWDHAVLYQVYPRSFADSNADGIGDLQGVISKLDHLQWLGVDAVWLNPTYPSPNKDWGYDVADYLGVHPDLGTAADLEELIAEAGRRGLHVLLDLVPNHTSSAHPWFRDPERRDWYIWRDPKPDGSPPNNWRAVFGGPAWSFDDASGELYMHNFLPEQPDLDWWNDGVRAAFDDILRYWFERGVSGFRIDVAHALVKDPLLRDNPPLRPGDPRQWARLGQRPMYNMGLPQAVDVHRRFRRIAQEPQDERLLLGETYVLDLGNLMRYVVPDGLQLCMNLVFLHTEFDPAELARVAAETEALYPPGATPVWHASSHDDVHFATRWCNGDEDAIRCALVALLSLRGTCILFQGDEIGMEAVEIPTDRVRDIFGRDPGRTPMVWSDEDGAGFTAPGVEPWLPIGRRDRNVSAQRDDAGSILSLTRDLVALRKESPLLTGAYLPVEAPPAVWAFRRGGGAFVALNLGEEPVTLPGIEGTIELGTNRRRDGERLTGVLELRAREAVVADVRT